MTPIKQSPVMPGLFKKLTVLLLLLSTTSAWPSEVNTLLSEKEAPPGVVFEIVSDESDLLARLLPAVKKDIKKLRDRFPDLPIAIVAHGLEQFALTRKNQGKETTAHGLVKELVMKNDIDVHVCGTHAGWYGVDPEDFPEYVDVTAAGPAQINDYEAMGYEVIILTD